MVKRMSCIINQLRNPQKRFFIVLSHPLDLDFRKVKPTYNPHLILDQIRNIISSNIIWNFKFILFTYYCQLLIILWSFCLCTVLAIYRYLFQLLLYTRKVYRTVFTDTSMMCTRKNIISNCGIKFVKTCWEFEPNLSDSSDYYTDLRTESE